jgi:hypothetical protein
LEKAQVVLMKTYYKVTCDIQVEASDDDTAIWLLQDACQLYPGLKFERWMFVEKDERAHDNNDDTQ